MNALISVIILGFLIFIHELGHFLFAKLFRVGVLEFAIGFGRKVFSSLKGETEYSLRLIPLGGFVRMVGDDPRLDINSPEITDRERVLLQDRSRWFLEKKYYQKVLIVLAGPLFNIISAVILAIAGVAYYGAAVPEDLPIIGTVIPGQPAEQAGLKEKDRVISINDKKVDSWVALADIVGESNGELLSFNVQRNEEGKGEYNAVVNVQAMRDEGELDVLRGEEAKPRYRIGIVPSTRTIQLTAGESVIEGSYRVWSLVQVTIRSFKGMILGLISPKHIGGPIAIFKEGTRSASRGFEAVINFMVLLSVSLGVLNLLPVPILDGGHLVFFTIEKLRGAPLNQKVYEVANQVGMVLLGVLMLFAFGNDLRQLFF